MLHISANKIAITLENHPVYFWRPNELVNGVKLPSSNIINGTWRSQKGKPNDKCNLDWLIIITFDVRLE